MIRQSVHNLQTYQSATATADVAVLLETVRQSRYKVDEV